MSADIAPGAPVVEVGIDREATYTPRDAARILDELYLKTGVAVPPVTRDETGEEIIERVRQFGKQTETLNVLELSLPSWEEAE